METKQRATPIIIDEFSYMPGVDQLGKNCIKMGKSGRLTIISTEKVKNNDFKL